MVDRRTCLAALVTGALPGLSGAQAPIDIFTADVRPLSIADGPRRGVVLDVVAQAFRVLGRDTRFVFQPFADAIAATRARAGSLMTPLARSPERESSFAWIAKVIDVPQAMGTLAGRPAVDLEQARSLQSIGVVRAGVQQAFLASRGFTNLVEFATAREIAQALAEQRVDAWYGTSPEIALQFEAIGRAGAARVGPTIQAAPVWLAGHPDTAALPVKEIQAAFAGLERDGTISSIYRTYVPV